MLFAQPDPKTAFVPSLLPERQIVISPSLAATIGLEEAVVLSCLAQLGDFLPSEKSRGYRWYQVQLKQLNRLLPFLTLERLQHALNSLRDKGILLVSSPPLAASGELRFAFDEAAGKSAAQPAPQPEQSSAFRAGQQMSPDWQPDRDCMALINQQGIPTSFARDQIAAFVQYWRERGEARHAWGNRFVQHVAREWQRFQASQQPAWQKQASQNATEPAAIDMNWQPSADALDILRVQAGVNESFIRDAIPEFVLFWQEKGERSNTWNARFINHVRRQWARFQHAVENDNDPRPIEGNWQPSADVWDVIDLARIERSFARELVPEFIIYWRDRNEARESWNTTFLQFVKRQWQMRHTANSGDNTRDRKLIDDLTDTSWAS